MRPVTSSESSDGLAAIVATEGLLLLQVPPYGVAVSLIVKPVQTVLGPIIGDRVDGAANIKDETQVSSSKRIILLIKIFWGKEAYNIDGQIIKFVRLINKYT